jgi:hypothetical protein
MKIILWQVTKINPNLLKLYDEKMLGTCKVNGEDVQRIHDKVNQILNEELTKSANYVRNMKDWLTAVLPLSHLRKFHLSATPGNDISCVDYVLTYVFNKYIIHHH